MGKIKNSTVKNTFGDGYEKEIVKPKQVMQKVN